MGLSPKVAGGEAKDWAGRLGPQHTSKAVPSSQGGGESSALATYPRKAEEPRSARNGPHPTALGSISGWKPQQGAVMDPQGAAAGALRRQDVWLLRVRGCHGPATCLMDLPHLSTWSREQRLQEPVGLFLWTEGSGPIPAPVPAAGLGATAHTHCLPCPLPIPVSPHPPLVFGASWM